MKVACLLNLREPKESSVYEGFGSVLSPTQASLIEFKKPDSSKSKGQKN